MYSLPNPKMDITELEVKTFNVTGGLARSLGRGVPWSGMKDCAPLNGQGNPETEREPAFPREGLRVTGNPKAVD